MIPMDTYGSAYTWALVYVSLEIAVMRSQDRIPDLQRQLYVSAPNAYEDT